MHCERTRRWAHAAWTALAATALFVPARAAPKPTPAPVKTEKATFASGCFWGVEAEFRAIKGVVSTAVGYTGGTVKDATYEQVCTGRTGHAEAVEVEYDPARVTYAQLLDVFWKNHDPTTRNRQGPDVGSQYRSAIFYHGEEQRKAAEESLHRLEKARAFPRPIVTQIVPAGPFYRAEDYHQQYLEKRGLARCHS
ncbi:MAG: peptide-methionine (S)-S-oxide reductase MsrA [Verrucomicrobiae bacterium]|nr:peptide-methionine (S)-S-oxide reductase MsrA [Verrucomicrobiae bacterium]